MYKNGDICPICGCDSLEKKEITETFVYKGHFLKIENYVIYECPGCGESIVDNATLKKSEKIIRDFHREVDGLLTSGEIKKIRKSLGFTQKEFGLLLGGGEKSFARYESCSVTQSKAMDNLIRILDKVPEAMDVLTKNDNSSGGSIISNPIQYSWAQGDKISFNVVGG